eukprot:4317409-Pyramimonas_sp.AAC.1
MRHHQTGCGPASRRAGPHRAGAVDRWKGMARRGRNGAAPTARRQKRKTDVHKILEAALPQSSLLRIESAASTAGDAC